MKILKTSKNSIIILAIIFFAGGCGQPSEEAREIVTESEMVLEEPDITNAICVLYPTEGNEAKGTVTFTQTAQGIRIEAEMEGLSEGKHGFHIHQYGDCSAPDATSAGGHFNPENTKHGAPSDTERHVGDLGNITADQTGRAELIMVDDMISFSGEHSIIGRAIVVHAGEDDFTSQPTGNVGARVACGIIGIDE